MKVKCLAQEHNTMSRPELEPGPLPPESSPITGLKINAFAGHQQMFSSRKSHEDQIALFDEIVK